LSLLIDGTECARYRPHPLAPDSAEYNIKSWLKKNFELKNICRCARVVMEIGDIGDVVDLVLFKWFVECDTLTT
jgi:hypothetical protein